MPSNCVICGNSAMKDPGVSFHRLPSSSERKRQWLTAFDVSEEEWCTHWRVCSRHFPEGNPKAAPLSYQDDQFATMWGLRKRAKLDQSRVTASSRQMKRNHLNSILTTRAAHGALSHPLPVINTVTTTSNSCTTTEELRAVHTRAPPVLLPVVSLPNHVMGGPVAVITRDPLKHSMSPACQHSTQSDTLASVHVHELVVVGLSADDDESESSDTGESMSGLNSGADASSELSGSRLSHTNINPASAVEHMTTSMVDRATTSSAVDHSIDAMSGDECATSAPRVDQGGAPLCSSDHSLRDVSVIVQSALLARITALDKDNHQLRQKLTPSSPLPTSPLCVRVIDATRGRPAVGVSVEVSVWESATAEWTPLGSGVTGVSGEYLALLAQSQLAPGLYRLHLDTQSYFSSQGQPQPYYPYVEVVFHLHCSTSHHCISLQLSPFSYTTSSHTL